MDTLGDALRVVAIIAGTGLALGLVVIGVVMWRYRIPPRGVVAMVVALFYLVSPIDVLPEVVLGPLGLVDDGGVLAVTALFVYRLVRAQRVLRRAGVSPRRRPRGGAEVTRVQRRGDER